MTYLVVPPLIESGMFREALSAMRAVCAFHEVRILCYCFCNAVLFISYHISVQSAAQDSGEMLFKACKMANYDKAIEIKNFASRCARSMQLALARSEFPLLVIADTKHTRADAVAYLKLYTAGFLLESTMDTEVCSYCCAAFGAYIIIYRLFRLKQTNKIAITLRTWTMMFCRPRARVKLTAALLLNVGKMCTFIVSAFFNSAMIAAIKIRRTGYNRRLAISRAVSALMLHLMQLDPAARISGCVENLRRVAAALPESSNLPLYTTTSFSSFAFGPGDFEQRIWCALCDVGAFVAESMRLATESSLVSEGSGIITGETMDSGSLLLELRDRVLISLNSLQESIVSSSSLPSPDGGAGDHAEAPPTSSWIRMASSFCLTVGNFCPLMLETLSEPLVHSSTKTNLKPLVASGSGKAKKSKGPKKAASAVNVPDGAVLIESVIKEVAMCLSENLGLY